MSEISSLTPHNSLSSIGKNTGGVLNGGSVDKSGDLKAAAIQFEAIFLKMFLDQARAAKLSDDILGSSASDTFQEMFDSELSKSSSSSMNLGLADVIVRQLQPNIVK
jgi:flagellar protein FlgJ|tara:strand:- start:1058 stop:1378 length:321 start_codon:yes stop_codon:yes gene_type:complete